MSSIEFYFDFSSPNAYFSAVQLRRLSGDYEELDVDWNPVFLGGLMKELDTTPPAMQNKAKADYLMTDMHRWSEYYDIPFDFPDSFPVNSLPALRTYLCVEEEDQGLAGDFATDVFRACWAEGKSIEEESVLRDNLPNGVRDTITIPDDPERESIKNELKLRTDRALDRGVFGCPTFFVEDEMYWGKDRLDFVKRHLNLD